MTNERNLSNFLCLFSSPEFFYYSSRDYGEWLFEPNKTFFLNVLLLFKYFIYFYPAGYAFYIILSVLDFQLCKDFMCRTRTTKFLIRST